MNGIDLAERGLLPDFLIRLGIWQANRQRLHTETVRSVERQFERYQERIEELRSSPVAINTDRANEQHYEVPAAFFQHVLGKNLKYSSCYWPQGVRDLDSAEDAMLELTCERAQLQDGDRILELGCGWGSITLWMASHYPNAQITAVSNSASQRRFIMDQAALRKLDNVEVITCDVNEFDTQERFDRAISIEMFEHVRNYKTLTSRIHDWLKPDGTLFVHIFCHAQHLYPFIDEEGVDDWMGRYFFSGGQMPAADTLLHFQDKLKLDAQWRVSGVHYQKTAEAWLQRQDMKKHLIMPVLQDVYGMDEAARWFQRWRMFFMACAETFGYDNGREWLVGHYRFRRPA
ncbi:MAG: cyclopropane-fatty-acyl-phospholipid synthase family protein [Pseudomonadota bacterium]